MKFYNFLRLVISAFCLIVATINLTAQINGPLLTSTNYIKYNDAIEYKLYQKGIGTQLVQPGDYIFMHTVQSLGDSSVINTYRDNANIPILNPVVGNGGSTDFSSLIYKMHEGDSLVVRLNLDSVFNGKVRPPYMRFGDELTYSIKVERIATKAEIDSVNAQLASSQQEEQKDEKTMLIKTLEELKSQAKKEDLEINKYLSQNKIKATKTKGGAYYYISKKGTGTYPLRGVTAVINYTGKFFPSMKTFDSNIDPKFKHEFPYGFIIGSGSATPGWEEIIPQLPVGTKATMIFPSQSGYGVKGGGTVIPPNTMLLYDIEITGLQ
jgi:FKBP-type peptidyl-prolyl cis-trans isomerase FkpA